MRRAAPLGVLLALTACSSEGQSPGIVGGAAGGAPSDSGALEDAEVALRVFTPPGDPGPRGILFTASGEAFATTGFAFPPADPDDPAFVDGWEVKFTRLLTTIDHVKLSDNPDFALGDQSQTGALVAQVNGPWAVDLARSDPANLPGKGSPGEQAVPIASLSKTNAGDDFAADGSRYAFGYDLIAASPTAYNVNLDAAGVADYRAMVTAGCAVLYVGTATFLGKGSSFPGCDVHPDWPTTVAFRLCFASPTTYENCQNPDNDPAAPLGDEEHERGIAVSPNQAVVAQVTLHTDHPFWDSVLHESPMHFDAYAARAVGMDAAAPLITLESMRGVDYTDYTDALGNRIDWRYCIDPPVDIHPKFTGPMRFDPHGVPHATSNDGATGLRDYEDFATYNQSTQGHLNADGLCYVTRRYPSPR